MRASGGLSKNLITTELDDLDAAAAHVFVAFAVTVLLFHIGVVIRLAVTFDVQPLLVSEVILADNQEIETVRAKVVFGGDYRSPSQIDFLPGWWTVGGMCQERPPIDADEGRHHLLFNRGGAVAQRVEVLEPCGPRGLHLLARILRARRIRTH